MQARKSSIRGFDETSGSSAREEHGAVVRKRGEAWVVRVPSGEVEAKRAHSCLVEPMLGDYVCVSSASEGGAYVLAILEREEGALTTLQVDGDLRVAPHGNVTVTGRESVDIEASKRVRVAGSHLDVEASTGEIVLGALSFLSAKLKAEISHARFTGDTVDSFFQRVSQTVKRSFRTVEETDKLEARDVDWSAQKNLSIHAGNTLVTSEELVKVDGAQIHLG